MNRSYRNYTDEDIIKYAAECTSMAQFLVKVGLRPAGGNYNNMRRKLQQLSIDCSHWTGQGWSKDKQLKDWAEYTQTTSIKPHLIQERGHKCERCLLSGWQGEDIPLEVEHSNGDRTDNRKENLLLLCCNCHALTKTWRGRKNKSSY